MRSEPGVPRDDEGFSLLEVLVSMAVITVAMAGIGAFFVNGTKAVAQERDKRQAVQVAAGAIEQVRALKGSSLLAGRGQTKAEAQWNTLLNGPYRPKMKRYMASMQKAWDTNILTAATDGDNAPISTATQNVTVGASSYNRDILVGRCEVYYLRDDDCVDPAYSSPPSNKAEILRYFRVVVLVSWTGKGCTDDKCSLIASTLISEATEPTFDSKAAQPELITRDVYFYQNETASYPLDVDHGQLPNVFAVASGSLPSWLTLTSGGTVTGKPTVAGDTTSSIKVTDSLGRTDTETITWHVVKPLSITVPTASESVVNTAVSLQVKGVDGVPTTYRYTLLTDLPDGVELDRKTGLITGTFTKNGDYTITVRVEDANGRTKEGTFVHTVHDPYGPLTLDAIAAKQVALGSAASGSAVARGGDTKYTYTLKNAPANVTINALTGALSGSPSVAGRYLPTVTVSDGIGGTASQTFELVVTTTTSLTFTAPNLVGADQTSASGSTVNLPVTTNAGVLLLKNVQYTVTGLPPGLKLNNGQDAVIGTPTTKGVYNVTITANSLLPTPQTAVLNLVWTIT
ncbi:putative Ig domain-containing protein [Actinoplanes sp. NPDC051861]|uniref:putative Ig domain-containing protein n=1 Tax=Actinoplanes sp. NPDC051861 TaxID=3155170 RepID=UPI00342D08EC